MSTEFDAKEELWELYDQDVTRALDDAEQALLAIESGEAGDYLNQLYRGLHSIKGNARAMSLELTESFTHQAEDLVALCRDGTIELTGEVLDLVLEAVDRLRAAIPPAVQERRDLCPEQDKDVTVLKDRLLEMVKILDVSGTREAATDEDFLLFDDLDFDSDEPSTPEAVEAIPAEEPSPSTPSEPAPNEAMLREPAPTASAEEPKPATSPKPSPAKEARPKASSKSPDDIFIQIRASKVREMLALASDLGLAADIVMSHPKVSSAAENTESLGEKIHRLRQLTRDLRFASAGLALVPVSDLFARLRRIGRDLARATGKSFDVVLKGETTEIDRFLIDQVYDPLMHVIRNAVDHGLEEEAARLAANKPTKGRIELRASNAGQGVVLEISDDGGGLDRDAILAKAISKELIKPEASLTDEQVWRLILEPGFSTRASVSNLSGRGVGMDVVNQAVMRLRGSLQIKSVKGQGTTFRIQLPLTLAFADVLLVEVAEQAYAIPLESIRRILTPSDEHYIHARGDGTEFLKAGSRPLPILRLTDESMSAPDLAVVLKSSRGDVALPIERLIGTEQVTLRPLSKILSGIRGAAACGLMANGEVAVTLDSERLVTNAA